MMGVIDFIKQKEFLSKYFLDLFKNNLNNISIISINNQPTYPGSGKTQSTYNFIFNVTLQYSFQIKKIDVVQYLYVKDANGMDILTIPITDDDLGGYSIYSIYCAVNEMRTNGDVFETLYNKIARKEKLIKINKEDENRG